MASLLVLIRIFLGWAGAWLLSKGVNVELVEFIQTDVTLHSIVANWATTIAGGVLMAAQLIWWRIAKKFGWST